MADQEQDQRDEDPIVILGRIYRPVAIALGLLFFLPVLHGLAGTFQGWVEHLTRWLGGG